MEDQTGQIAGLGTAVGLVLYAGAEIFRRILRSSNPTDPKQQACLERMAADLKRIEKSMNEIREKYDRLAEHISHQDARIAVVEDRGSRK